MDELRGYEPSGPKARRRAVAVTAACAAVLAAVAAGQLARSGVGGGAQALVTSTPVATPPSHTMSAPTLSAVPSVPAPPTTSAAPSPRVLRTLPWLDQQVAVNSRLDYATFVPTTRNEAPACRSSDIDVVPDQGPGLGSLNGSLSVHNSSAHACSLLGAPHLALVSASGVVFASSSPHPLYEEPAKLVILEPGSWAVSGPWLIGASCGGEGRTTTLRVQLPGDDTVRTVPFVVGSDTGPRGCIVADVVPRGVPHPGQLDTPPFTAMWRGQGYLPTDLAGLYASIRAPATVHAGDTLAYTVLLTFPGDDSRRGGPADLMVVGDGASPLYVQRFGAASSGPYALRWDEATALRPWEAMAYEMRVLVPADTPPGPQTLTWQIVEPSTALPPVSATVTVVAP